MAYVFDEETNSLVIDGFESGIASSPYKGIGSMRNVNTSYYPGVAYVNYKRQAATLGFLGGAFFAGIHSVNVSNNLGWIFTSAGIAIMTNPVQEATSTAGLNYILDDSGQVWKQSSVNSSTFNVLENGGGRLGSGSGGLAYWNNYLVVIGDGLIEFCGDGTGDAGINQSTWNLYNSGTANNTFVFTTTFATDPTKLFYFGTTSTTLPKLVVNDSITFTTTGTLPASLVVGTTYFIASVNSSYITISATVGGSEINLSSDGTGIQTAIDTSNPLPLGNISTFSYSGLIAGVTSFTLESYDDPHGTTITSFWKGVTGTYVLTLGTLSLPIILTNNSNSIGLLSPFVYSALGFSFIQIIDPNVTNYRAYVSKVDGSLYFANGQFLGRIAAVSSPNVAFNPGLTSTYSVSYGVTALPEQHKDSIVDMTDLNKELIVAGQKDTYTWDYQSSATSSPSPVGEQIVRIKNILNNIYITAGQKGNLYISNGYSSQLLCKIPDFIAGVIDPVWSFGGMMTHRSKLFFQALAQTPSGTNILAGIFSLIVSPPIIGDSAAGIIMESQNSYGLTPSTGTLSSGILIDNSPSSTGYDSYYSAWSNGASLGGIDYNNTTLWDNFEPTIETDIIPIGTILDKKTFGNIEFKLDRPMASGDSIQMYWRPSLSDSYTLMGTTSTTLLSGYYPSNISQSQWAQFKIQMKCASSNSSFIPLREVRLHFD